MTWISEWNLTMFVRIYPVSMDKIYNIYMPLYGFSKPNLPKSIYLLEKKINTKNNHTVMFHN